jgi:hypothetical protein
MDGSKSKRLVATRIAVHGFHRKLMFILSVLFKTQIINEMFHITDENCGSQVYHGQCERCHILILKKKKKEDSVYYRRQERSKLICTLCSIPSFVY